MARGFSDPDQPIYVISIAAELAGVHPQTLRVYERKGLVSPKRTEGNSRRYSERDIAILQRVQELSNEGINLAGVMRIMELEQQIENLRRRHARMSDQMAALQDQVQEAISARDANAMVPLRDMRRIRRAMKADLMEQMGRARDPFAVPPISQAEDNR
ncbi:MAG: heat shock protein transcriptional repressor HspR [Actinomycetota bacterium]